jgi:hypothetical protein
VKPGARLRPLLRRLFRRAQGGISGPAQDRASDTAFRDFVASAIDKAAYLNANPDVRVAGIDPAHHWLEHGIFEGRPLAPDIVVQRGVAPTQWRPRSVQRFIWRGEAITISRALPPALVRQIMAQARHEPAIRAPGATAVPYLRWHEAQDLIGRDHVDADALFRAVPEPPETILITPRSRHDEARQYGEDLVDALTTAGGGTVLVVVTDQTANQAEGWRQARTPAAFPNLSTVHWRDVCGETSQDDPRILAHFLNALRPKRVVVIGSRLGLHTVAHFGRGLSQHIFLCCVYLTTDTQSSAEPPDSRFPRLTIPHALAVTDNSEMATIFDTLYGELKGPGIAVLPRRVAKTADAFVGNRVIDRLPSIKSPGGQRRWACIALSATSENVAILTALAAHRASDRIEVFELVQGVPPAPTLNAPNMLIAGVLADVCSADFSPYDGIVFTSPFDSLRRMVLEISQHGIPMVLPDSSGLRDTLDDSCAVFVANAETTASTGAAFARALDQVAAMSADQATSMARIALERVTARHGPTIHARTVARLFGLA